MRAWRAEEAGWCSEEERMVVVFVFVLGPKVEGRELWFAMFVAQIISWRPRFQVGMTVSFGHGRPLSVLPELSSAWER